LSCILDNIVQNGGMINSSKMEKFVHPCAVEPLPARAGQPRTA
jgi:hypothetical protein